MLANEPEILKFASEATYSRPSRSVIFSSSLWLAIQRTARVARSIAIRTWLRSLHHVRLTFAQYRPTIHSDRLRWPAPQDKEQLFPQASREPSMIVVGCKRITGTIDDDLLGLGYVAPVSIVPSAVTDRVGDAKMTHLVSS